MRPDILTPAEVAREWGCSERHVRNMINRGQLGHFRLGGKLLRIPRAAITEAEEQSFRKATGSDGAAPKAPQDADTISPPPDAGNSPKPGSAAVTRARLAALRRRNALSLNMKD